MLERITLPEAMETLDDGDYAGLRMIRMSTVFCNILLPGHS